MSELQIDRLTVEYASGGYLVRPIEDFTLHAGSGELVLLLGPSGCGKTTLLSCLAAILSPTSGSIRVDGVDVATLSGAALTTYRRHGVGIVFQAFNLVPSLTAAENVAAPLWAAGVGRRAGRSRAEELLEQMNLSDRARHRPGALSGGQQQRVAIARALAHDPALLLADEPTAHLDYMQVESVIGILRQLAAPGRLVIVATHDERMIPLADRVVRLAPALSTSAGPRAVQLSAGEVLFTQGSRGSLIYVVERGEVDLLRTRMDGGEETVATVRAGEYFGELGPLLGFPRTATARARTAASLTGYSVSDFRDHIGADELAALLGKRASARTPPAKSAASRTGLPAG
ncbi:MAG TPA: ATP-binding cassette domain-containing protein [Mycobacteriales bacterium]|nr:ATP-binding cassette domain-containing protein [Mycobacteriales bacterium]